MLLGSLDFSNFDDRWLELLSAAGTSLALAAVAFVGGTVLGTPLGIVAGKVKSRRLSWLALLPNDILRAFPPYVLLYVARYNFAPFGTRLSPFAAAAFALGIAQFAYSLDLARSVSRVASPALVRSAEVLGLSPGAVWRRALWPDLVRRLLPAQLAFALGTVRLTSFASIFGVTEIAWAASAFTGNSGRTFESWLVVSAAYVALSIPLIVGSRYLEESRWIRRLV